jgi:hypothetical protein
MKPVFRLLSAGLLLAAALAGAAEDWNGFDLTGANVPLAMLTHGGQPRDGIPAITTPKFIPTREAGIDFEARVVGVVVNGIARAYPRSVLVWHEVVNDRIGDTAVVIVYSPLSGAVAGYLASLAGQDVEFGVSGLLYNSGTLLFDRGTESLWLPVEGVAISGPRQGQHLQAIAAVETSWADWQQRYSQGKVMTADTGHDRPYGRDPYAEYMANSELRFAVAPHSDRYHPKEPVLVITHLGWYRAYPFVELAAQDAPFTDQVNGASYTIDFNYADQRVSVTDAAGEPAASPTEYWFAWHAGHPKDEVYTASRKEKLPH